MARTDWLDINGVLLLDKPYGLSSNDALQRARRIFRARKGGHAGTLDPLATGLLPIAFGQATKFLNDLIGANKTYRATVRLGQSSSTGDGEGEILADPEQSVVAGLTRAQIEQGLATLVGVSEQRPPMYSAVKHKGKPLYTYARQGQEIERAPRQITVENLDLLEAALPDLDVRITCSKGTYIRVLAQDIGQALGCNAYLAQLRRERVADFAVDDAQTFERIDCYVDGSPASQAALADMLGPVDAMLGALPICQLSEYPAARFRQGQSIGTPHFAADISLAGATRCRVYEQQRFLGLAVIDGATLSPKRLIVDPVAD